MAAKFGWTPSQFNELTYTQRVLLMRAIEDREARDAQTMRDAVLNAISNAFMKRGSKPLQMFEVIKKHVKQMSRADALEKMKQIQNNF